MTSKEALEKLINKTGIINDTCEHLLACVKRGKCKFEQPIETCADYQLVMTIEKDLEILEILKNSLELEEEDDDISFKFKFCCYKESLNDDYEIRTIKEWLESE